MNSPEVEVLLKAVQWLKEGTPTLLVTVASSRGSTPRPAGSIMAISSRMQIAGSVSGGCLESELLEHFSSRASSLVSPQTVSCSVTGSKRIEAGVLCQSDMTLVIERLADIQPLQRIVDQIQSNRLMKRELDVITGESWLEETQRPQPVSFDSTRLTKTFGPHWHLLLIGANDLAAYIAEIAQALGFAVTICEPRETYRACWDAHRFPVARAMPDDLIASLVRDDRHAIVALSHDPRLDDMALMSALRSPAFYVGAVGSRRTSTARRERLRQLGLAADTVARLHGPVGVPIGSRTPPEIAVSILAEIVAARRHGSPSPASGTGATHALA